MATEIRAGALDGRALDELDAMLAEADARLLAEQLAAEQRLAAGPRSSTGTGSGTGTGQAAGPGPQPLHTVYLPADQVEPGSPAAWGDRALELLAEHAPDAAALAGATGLPAELVAQCYPLVVSRLRSLPVEDLRIDFEDGFGRRADEVEDAAATRAARTITAVTRQPRAPRWIGLRCKSLEPATRHRGLRTLDLVIAALAAGDGLPDRFVLTLPKVTSADQVRAMVRACELLEQAHRLPSGRLGFELQVETPQAILDHAGTAGLAAMVRAAAGRCTGLHYGTYDYSAALGIAAAHQRLDHPAAEHAKFVMQLVAAGTGVWLSDGSTNVVPDGARERVYAAWRLHAELVTRSLSMGFYQGWDLAPGHLVTRYLATFAFFRAAFPAAAARLRAYTARAGGEVLDEPATAAALAGAVLRALDSGAVGADEARAGTGLDRPALEALLRRAG